MTGLRAACNQRKQSQWAGPGMNLLWATSPAVKHVRPTSSRTACSQNKFSILHTMYPAHHGCPHRCPAATGCCPCAGCVLEEMMTGPYPNNRKPHTYPKQMPALGELLSGLQDTAPPQLRGTAPPQLRGTAPPQDLKGKFAEVYKSCVQSEAALRPTAQTVKDWLDELYKAG
jgi:ferredoxin